MKPRKKNVSREGFSSQTDIDRKLVESRTVLKDKMYHLIFKLKMLEDWIYEKRKRKDPNVKELEVKQHNMKHEYNRVIKLLEKK